VSDLETLANAATRELLDHTVTDVPARFAELKRARARRTTAKLATAAAVLALGIVGWQLGRESHPRDVQPVTPPVEVHNGALLGLRNDGSAASPTLALAYGGGGPNGPYGGMDEHLPTDLDSEPLLQFSPDGATFFYSDDQSKLVAWDFATQRKTELANCPQRGCLTGSISPDGSTGIFPGDGDAILVDLDSGDSQSLALPVQAVRTPVWSADSKQLAFTSSEGLWTMEADGSDPTLVRPAAGGGASPPAGVAWSPDGDRIAFFDVSDDGDYTLMMVRPDGTDVVVVHAVGGCQCDRVGPPSVVWSPDGTELAVTTSADEPGQPAGVYTVAADGTGWTPRATGAWSSLAWQPLSAE
jgi:WD40 repeat protein